MIKFVKKTIEIIEKYIKNIMGLIKKINKKIIILLNLTNKPAKKSKVLHKIYIFWNL